MSDAGGTTPWTEHPNAAVVREFFAAFGAADPDRLRAVTTPELVWHFPGTSPIAGDWRGVDGLPHGIRAIAMTLGDGHAGFELLDLFANAGGAVSVHRDFYEGPGNHFDQRFVTYYRMEGGRIAEAWETPFDQRESDRYFGRQAGEIVRRQALAAAPA